MRIFVAVALFMVGGVHAEDCRRMDTPSTLQFGANYTHAFIKVDDQSSFSGNLGGVQGCYEYRARNGFYEGLKASWKQGKTNSSHASRQLVYIDAQERLGYSLPLTCNEWTLTLFSGFGYRYLGHKLKQSGESTVKFNYNEFYVPVGFLAEYLFNSCWKLGLNFIWMPQVYPTVEIVPLKGARWILRNMLSNATVELPLTYSLKGNRCFSFVFKPFYERWEDGPSTAKTANGQKLGLPKNSYDFWGAEFNLAVTF